MMVWDDDERSTRGITRYPKSIEYTHPEPEEDLGVFLKSIVQATGGCGPKPTHVVDLRPRRSSQKLRLSEQGRRFLEEVTPETIYHARAKHSVPLCDILNGYESDPDPEGVDS